MSSGKASSMAGDVQIGCPEAIALGLQLTRGAANGGIYLFTSRTDP
jgi:hypothetical protein